MPRFGEDSPIEGEHDLVSAGFSTCLHALCWHVSGFQALWSWGSMELFAWTSKEEIGQGICFAVFCWSIDSGEYSEAVWDSTGMYVLIMHFPLVHIMCVL